MLQGVVERVTFLSEESGYTVLRVKVKGHRDLVTVVGFVSSVSPGENVESFGEWVQTREYGRQFKAKSLRVIAPSTLEGVEKYLGSGMVKGIGPHFAAKLVRAFGFEVFDVIEQAPEKLRTVEGIGPKRIERITSAWKDQKVIRSIMVFLQGHGVSTSKAVRIFKTYGDQAIERVRANPYQLARDIHGIGFKSADVIAEKLGIAKNSLIRARAGASFALMECVQDGHCAYPEGDLFRQAAQSKIIQAAHRINEGELPELAPREGSDFYFIGSEEAEAIPLATQHYMMLKRNLVYTGVTRGKRLVVLIGQKKALAIAVKSTGQERRWTNLRAKAEASLGTIQ